MTAQAAAVEGFSPEAAPRRHAFSGAGVLSVSMVVSGGLTYAFQILAARTLGPSGYGSIAVLWRALQRPVRRSSSAPPFASLAR